MGKNGVILVLCHCAVTSFKFLPATVQGDQGQTMMATYEQVPTDNEASPWPAELRQAAASAGGVDTVYGTKITPFLPIFGH